MNVHVPFTEEEDEIQESEFILSNDIQEVSRGKRETSSIDPQARILPLQKNLVSGKPHSA